ncbi:MAG: hypothetical protein ABIG56_06355 [Candidatus Omnitrophota bacterium]
MSRKLAIFLILVLFSVNNLYSAETAGLTYLIDLATLLSGGSAVSSTLYEINYSSVGDGAGSVSELTSTEFSMHAGQIALISLDEEEPQLRWIISNLKARERVLGPVIPESTWQNDDDPYFYWDVLTAPASIIKGFSISLDELPDLTIDTKIASYEFALDSIPSGKHTFYVLPLLSETVADEDSMLNFEIWVDLEPPVISQISPSSGAYVFDPNTAISCNITDKDSGFDFDSTTFRLNDKSIEFERDPETQLLQFIPKEALSEGKHTVMVEALDLAGNKITKAWQFIIDTKPPQGEVLINAGEEITFSARVSIMIKATDTVSGIKSIYISNDGIFDSELKNPIPYTPVIYNWIVKDPEVDGTKTVFVKFQDSAGNLSAEYKDEIILKLMTPDTRIVSGPISTTAATEANFVFEATKAECKFSYKLDGREWSGWSAAAEVNFTELSEGNHYFYVKSGYDLNGDNEISLDEEDSTPATWVWAVKSEEYFEQLRERILFWKR